MELRQLHKDFCVCKVTDVTEIGALLPHTFLAVTGEEISLVCEATRVPRGATDVEPGWRGVMIVGVIDFGVVGVVARISAALAKRDIPLFVVSTFNTDYIFVKSGAYPAALEALEKEGYTLCD